MTATFDATTLKVQLSALPATSAFAFGVLIFERAWPGYLAFLTDVELTDDWGLGKARRDLWLALEKGDPEMFSFSSTNGIVDTEDYSSLYTSSALDAINIAYCMSDYSASADEALLVEAASLRIDSIDLFVQNAFLGENLKGGDLDEAIRSRREYQEELFFQRKDLDTLRNIDRDIESIYTIADSLSQDGHYSTLKLFA